MLLYLILGELYWLAVLCTNPPPIRNYSLPMTCFASAFVISIWPLPVSFLIHRILRNVIRG
jgi:hypothetical protein